MSFNYLICNNFQILKNNFFADYTGHGYNTTISQLLEESGQLSVNQLVVYHTLLTVFKMVTTGEPGYLAERLSVGQGSALTTLNFNFQL